jgi:hypothetical protein
MGKWATFSSRKPGKRYLRNFGPPKIFSFGYFLFPVGEPFRNGAEIPRQLMVENTMYSIESQL